MKTFSIPCIPVHTFRPKVSHRQGHKPLGYPLARTAKLEQETFLWQKWWTWSYFKSSDQACDFLSENQPTNTVKTWIIGRCAMSLDFPLLVRSRIFCFFFCLGGGKGAVFLLCFCPLSREGNSGLHSTPSNYSSFYGSWLDSNNHPLQVGQD